MYKRLIFIIVFLGFNHSGFSQPVVGQGLIDARSFDFTKNGLPLNGQWFWYDNKLLTPDETIYQKAELVEFPKTWDEVRDSKNGQGVATYSLTVLAPGNIPRLAVEIPAMYNSYRLWVNDKLVASNGSPGKTKEETVPQWLRQTVSFENNSDSIRITLQIANFHHYRGGCKSSIYLGEAANMMAKQTISTASKLTECATLFVFAVVYAIIYFFRGRKKAAIYFALLCLTWSIRSVFYNNYIFISFFPDFNWTLMVKIEYLTLYFTTIWSILFLTRLFPAESSPIFKYLLVALNGLFILFTVLSAPVDFTRFVPVYIITIGVLILYSIQVVFRALVNERTGSGFLSGSILLALALFTYDIFAYEGIFSYVPLVFSIAYIVIFAIVGVAILLYLNILKSLTKSSDTLTYKDFF